MKERLTEGGKEGEREGGRREKGRREKGRVADSMRVRERERVKEMARERERERERERGSKFHPRGLIKYGNYNC